MDSQELLLPQPYSTRNNATSGNAMTPGHQKLLHKTLLWMLEETPSTSDLMTKQNHRVTSEWGPGNEDKWERMPILKVKTKLVLKSPLVINESIKDSEAIQGYEGLPKQIDQIH